MSYEGYYQIICENNHYSTMDCYSFSFGHSKCPYCNGNILKYNSVDETNGTSDGYDPDFGKDAIHPVTIMSDVLDAMQTEAESCRQNLQELENAIENLKEILGDVTRSPSAILAEAQRQVLITLNKLHKDKRKEKKGPEE